MRRTEVTVWIRRAAGMLFIGVLAGCATPYQPMGATGGFAQRQLAADRWQVEFRGNGNTSATLVANMYLYRCAEIAVQHRFDVFRAMRADDAAPQAWSNPMAAPASAGAAAGAVPLAASADSGSDQAPTEFRSHGRTVSVVTVPARPVTIYHMQGVVRMGRYADVPSNVQVWDARAVLRVLEPAVRGTGARAGVAEDEVARVALVSGRGRPAATAGTTLDDLRGLLQQP